MLRRKKRSLPLPKGRRERPLNRPPLPRNRPRRLTQRPRRKPSLRRPPPRPRPASSRFADEKPGLGRAFFWSRVLPMFILGRLISRSSRSLAVMIGFGRSSSGRGRGEARGRPSIALRAGLLPPPAVPPLPVVPEISARQGATMDRRAFVISAAAAVLPWRIAFSQSGWRTFEVTTRAEVDFAEGVSRVWLPLPLAEDTEWHRSLGSAWSGNAPRAEVVRDGEYGVTMLYAEWPAGHAVPRIEVTSKFSTRDRAVDVGRRDANAKALGPAEYTFYTAPTEWIPTDGIVRDTVGGDPLRRRSVEGVLRRAQRFRIRIATADVDRAVARGELAGDLDARRSMTRRPFGIQHRHAVLAVAHDFGARRVARPRAAEAAMPLGVPGQGQRQPDARHAFRKIDFRSRGDLESAPPGLSESYSPRQNGGCSAYHEGSTIHGRSLAG